MDINWWELNSVVHFVLPRIETYHHLSVCCFTRGWVYYWTTKFLQVYCLFLIGTDYCCTVLSYVVDSPWYVQALGVKYAWWLLCWLVTVAVKTLSASWVINLGV